MGFKFPYGNQQQLNLDWFIRKFKELVAAWNEKEESIDGALDAEIQRAEDALTDVYTARDVAVAAKNDAVDAKNDAVSAKNDAVTAKVAAETAKSYANIDALRSEGWAVGEQNATPVASDSPYYENNAKYYKQQADADATATAADRVQTGLDKTATAADALKAEGYASGTQNGTPVASDSPYYQNNGAYYKQKAEDAADAADTLKDNANAAALRAEGWADGTQYGTPVTSESPYYENNAKYYKEAAEDVLNSIPADYSELAAEVASQSEKIEDLKSATEELSDEVFDNSVKPVLDSEFESSRIYNASGVKQTFGGFSATDIIEIDEDSVRIEYKLYLFAADYSALNFYDSSKTFISNLLGSGLTEGVAEIPANAKYFSAFKYDNYSSEEYVKQVKKSAKYPPLILAVNSKATEALAKSDALEELIYGLSVLNLDTSTFTKTGYYDLNGAYVNGTGWASSDYIPVGANKTVSYKIYAVSAIAGIAFYNSSKTFIGKIDQSGASSGTIYENSTELPDGTAFITATLLAAQLENESVSLSRNVLFPNTAKQLYSNAIYVAKNGIGDFENIQDAIEYAKLIQSKQNPVTIFISEGTFERFSLKDGTYYISLIGCGREKTIIKSTTGLYSSPSCEIATNGIIKGITFLSTHDDIETLPSGDHGSYAVHADYPGFDDDVDFVFEDCNFISYQMSAFGCGLHNNEHLVLRNCNFYSYYTRAFNEEAYNGFPSLLIHGSFVDNDKNSVVVENCKGYTKECIYAINVYEHPDHATDMSIEFRNCQFWCDSSYRAANITIADLTQLSAGNNINDMNYQYD